MTQWPRRTDLLDAALDAAVVQRVHLTRVELGPGQAPGAHHHPCDVVGVVESGRIVFRLEGAEEVSLAAGDAFHEPRDAHVLRFDNASDTEPALFLAWYLLPPGVTDLIVMDAP